MSFEALEFPGFLIAAPELEDPNFKSTVVALIHHDEQGSFGLVLNRPGDLFLSDILPEFENSPNARCMVFLGGPVEQNRLFVLHDGDTEIPRSEFCVRVSEKLFFEPNFQVLESVISLRKFPHLRLYLGYAGWTAGQLLEELSQRTWIPAPIFAEIIDIKIGKEMWHQALAKKGPYYALIGQTGFRPSLN